MRAAVLVTIAADMWAACGGTAIIDDPLAADDTGTGGRSGGGIGGDGDGGDAGVGGQPLACDAACEGSCSDKCNELVACSSFIGDDLYCSDFDEDDDGAMVFELCFSACQQIANQDFELFWPFCSETVEYGKMLVPGYEVICGG